MLLLTIFSLKVFGKDFVSFRDVNRTCVGDYCFPRMIWTHWDGDIPDDVQEMIDVSRESLVNFTWCFLSEKNLSDFLDLSSFPEGFHEYIPAKRSDYIRTRLIEKYGGIWIDSTMFVNSGKEMEWFISEAIAAKCQVVSFYHRRFICPNFFGAPENSVLMKMFRDEYEIALRNDTEYIENTCSLLKGKIKLGENCSPLFLLDLALKKVKYDNASFMDANLLLLPAKRSHYRLEYECHWKGECVKARLRRGDANHIPFVKVFHQNRDGKRFNIKNSENQTDRKSVV